MITKIEDKILGIRKGFGDEQTLLETAKRADSRPLSTYFIPALTLLVMICFHLLLSLNEDFNNFGGVMFRVFVFDYTIFVLAALSGLDMCRRWRKSSTRIQELSLSPLMPAVVGKSLFIGPLRWWLVAFLIFAVIETIFSLPIQSSVMNFTFSSQGFSGNFLSVIMILFAIITGPILFAWFHFESAHLAHWMFSQHSLPRIKLRVAGVSTFFLINVIVFFFSGLGSILTLFFAVMFSIIITAFGGGNDQIFEQSMGSYYTWYVSAGFVAAFIALCKRLICKDFENRFSRSWLMYQWWGAGEHKQPDSYPTHFLKAIGLWNLMYKAEEERNRGVPEHRRKHERNYKSVLQKMKNESDVIHPDASRPREWK